MTNGNGKTVDQEISAFETLLRRGIGNDKVAEKCRDRMKTSVQPAFYRGSEKYSRGHEERI